MLLSRSLFETNLFKNLLKTLPTIANMLGRKFLSVYQNQSKPWYSHKILNICYIFAGYVQTDDRTALQEIARQLNLENVMGDQVFVSFQMCPLFVSNLVISKD